MKIEKTNAKERVRKMRHDIGYLAPRNVYDMTLQNAHLISDIMDSEFETDCYQTLVLRKALFTLNMSPTGAALIDDGIKSKWRLCLRDLQGVEFSIDTNFKTLTLDHEGLSGETLLTSEYFQNVVLAALVKGLRDIWHEKRQGGFENLFSPEALLVLERVRAADCDVLAILCAWELRSEGMGHIWRTMIGSDLGDIAMVFSSHLERNPSSHFDHKALLSAFEHWFEDIERIDSCDHMTLNYIDELMADEGTEAFGDKVPTHICVELLSCLPDKTTYLQGRGKKILKDDHYTAIHDEINRMHFYHILRDMEATIVENVAFRDADLASKIFPYEGVETASDKTLIE